MNNWKRSVGLFVLLAARSAAGQSLDAVAVARTPAGDVVRQGLASASSDYRASVSGTPFEAFAQTITSGGSQPMTDTNGFGTNAIAIGGGRVFYTFSVAGPGVRPVPVIVRARVHVDTFGPAIATARFTWQNNIWAALAVGVQGPGTADRSLYAYTSLVPGFSEAFEVQANGQIAFGLAGSGNHGEFQAIADPEVYIDPAFPDRDLYSIVLPPGLSSAGAPTCDVSPNDWLTIAPGSPISFTVTGTAATPGDAVTLSSTNLPASVTIDGTWPATGASVVSRTFSWTPTTAEIGTYLLKFTVTDEAGPIVQRTKSIHVTANPLEIVSFAPSRGPADTAVTIAGAHLGGVTAVLFNTVPAIFNVESESQITATVPSGARSGPIHLLTDVDDVASAASFGIGAANLGPPVTTAVLSGPSGNAGWYQGAVHVALTATDPDGPADVASTSCSLDGGTVRPCDAPVIVSGDGIHVLLFRSLDRAGNEEALQTLSIAIDAAPPVVRARTPTGVLWPPDGRMVAVKFAGRLEDVMSGVDPASVAYQVADQYGTIEPAGTARATADGRFAFTIRLQAKRRGTDRTGRRYTVTVTGRDTAGNTGSARVVVLVPHDQRCSSMTASSTSRPGRTASTGRKASGVSTRFNCVSRSSLSGSI